MSEAIHAIDRRRLVRLIGSAGATATAVYACTSSFEEPGRASASERGFKFHGHRELTQYFDGHTHAPAAWHKHVTTNPMIRVDGDRATATSYFVRVDAGATAGPAAIVASGRYLDELVRDATGRWRISSRRCEVENL